MPVNTTRQHDSHPQKGDHDMNATVKPHRMLTLASGGFMEGADVRQVQAALKAAHRHLSGLLVDGEYGPATASAAAWWKRWVGGFPAKSLTKGWAPTLSPSSQMMLLGTKPLPRVWKWRAAYRWRQLKKRQEARSLGEKAADWASSHVGLTESPAGTNKVPQLVADAKAQGVIAWIAAMGFPWCAFGFWLSYLHAGSVTAARVMRLYAWNGLYTPTILDLALAGHEGMRVIGFSEITRGAGLLIDFPGGDPRVDHIEMAAGAPQGEAVRTFGFNTSFEGRAGSQANGGAVAARIRTKQQIRAAFVVSNPAA